MSGGYRHRAALPPRLRLSASHAEQARKNAAAVRRRNAELEEALRLALDQLEDERRSCRCGWEQPATPTPITRPAYDTSPAAGTQRLEDAADEMDAWRAQHPDWDGRRQRRRRAEARQAEEAVAA